MNTQVKIQIYGDPESGQFASFSKHLRNFFSEIQVDSPDKIPLLLKQCEEFGFNKIDDCNLDDYFFESISINMDLAKHLHVNDKITTGCFIGLDDNGKEVLNSFHNPKSDIFFVLISKKWHSPNNVELIFQFSDL